MSNWPLPKGQLMFTKEAYMIFHGCAGEGIAIYRRWTCWKDLLGQNLHCVQLPCVTASYYCDLQIAVSSESLLWKAATIISTPLETRSLRFELERCVTMTLRQIKFCLPYWCVSIGQYLTQELYIIFRACCFGCLGTKFTFSATGRFSPAQSQVLIWRCLNFFKDELLRSYQTT